MKLDNAFFDELLEKAALNERRRINHDLRNGAEDNSQRLLNALMPDTVVPVHRHHCSSETMTLLRGSMAVVIYDDGGKVVERYELSTGEVMQIPKDTWHNVEVYEPSVIFEAKDGAYRPLIETEIL